MYVDSSKRGSVPSLLEAATSTYMAEGSTSIAVCETMIACRRLSVCTYIQYRYNARRSETNSRDEMDGKNYGEVIVHVPVREWS